MTGPEPGWYPDPEEAGAARYWDGIAWTEHVHRGVSTGAPDVPGPPRDVLDQARRGTSWQPDAPGPPPPPGPPSPPGPPVASTAPATPTRASSGAPLVLVVVLASIVIVGVLGVFSVVGSMRSDLAAGIDAARGPGPSPRAEQREVDPDAPAAGGCVEADPGAGDDRSHFELATAPPPGDIYDVPLPAWGPHTAHVLPETPIPVEPLDVRILLHNLEHGAVVVWFDEDAIDARDLAAMNAWMAELRASGFTSASGATIFVSPAPADVDVAAISLRAWGVAVDCPAWAPAAADAFVAAHYGSRGEAPEGALGPYPEDGPLVDP